MFIFMRHKLFNYKVYRPESTRRTISPPNAHALFLMPLSGEITSTSTGTAAAIRGDAYIDSTVTAPPFSTISWEEFGTNGGTVSISRATFNRRTDTIGQYVNLAFSRSLGTPAERDSFITSFIACDDGIYTDTCEFNLTYPLASPPAFNGVRLITVAKYGNSIRNVKYESFTGNTKPYLVMISGG